MRTLVHKMTERQAIIWQQPCFSFFWVITVCSLFGCHVTPQVKSCDLAVVFFANYRMVLSIEHVNGNTANDTMKKNLNVYTLSNHSEIIWVSNINISLFYEFLYILYYMNKIYYIHIYTLSETLRSVTAQYNSEWVDSFYSPHSHSDTFSL